MERIEKKFKEYIKKIKIKKSSNILLMIKKAGKNFNFSYTNVL